MTLDERGKRWMAYMDGQMSASEALEFERSLSPDDQKRLDDEVRLEAALCDTLSRQECCPVALWSSLTAQMRAPSPKSASMLRWQRRFVALAASVAIMVTSSMLYRQIAPERASNIASGLEITENNLADFARHTEVPGTRESIQRFLDQHQIGLTLVGLEDASLDPRHPVELLGACVGNCPSGSLIEIRLICCGKPVKLLIAREDSGGAKLIRSASRCGKVKASRLTNGMLTALIGDIHSNDALLNLLQPVADNIV